MKFIIIAVLTFFSFACDQTVQNSESDFNYRFLHNNCSTGQHTFSTKEDYCDALKDEELNNSCALDQREEEFNKSCQSISTQSFSYKLTGKNCKVEHSFSDLKAFCLALIDDLFNKYCAPEERQKLYKMHCMDN